MVEPRLKSKITVSAWLRMGDAAGKPGMVLKRGDPDAGAILLLLRGREGISVLSQIRTPEGAAAWIQLGGPLPLDQTAVDALVERQLRFDGDLWVVEFETPDLQPPFELTFAG